ncbi:MAG TPA: TetR/AcrR family transcriptional regulator [Chitinophagaceae bacterium]|nr:TetR/AcrR family transcriptional regulator [Chitinophagaceae bacterium]
MSALDSKDRIREKANELFLQYGIRSVSMDDIAASLGMSKKTIYQYFADKDELVEAVVDSHISQMQGDCANCRKNARDAIHEMMMTMEMVIEQLRDMNPVVLNDLAKFHLGAYERFLEHKNKYLARVIHDNIEWGKKEGLYRREVNTDVMSRFRLESMMIPFNISLFPPGKFNLAATSAQIIEHFVYGLATVKGHRLIQKYKQDKKSTSHDKKLVS